MPLRLPDSESAIQICQQDLNLPQGLILRRLEIEDYHRGFLECLAELTIIGNISMEEYRDQFLFIQQRPDDYFVFVVVDEAIGQVVGCCSLLVERKFIRQCGLVGHIEDVCVKSTKRGIRLGKHLVTFCHRLASQLGCYKAILDCKEEMVPFYQKCGLSPAGVQMSTYFAPTKGK